MLNLRATLDALRKGRENDDVIDLNDDEMLEMLDLLASEYVARLPRYALRQGDLPLSAEPAILAREIILEKIQEARQ